ncbi:MAG: hypothetical protein JL50_01020 [Peptococcaceae bacterium BICA1-7]|nr:MAG: hypothetical protein JL50_01020 [Peptococcaceae bacterium BICA1-7]HBV98029.1 hypothetical protein [Desulfotomaculum sp.]
MIGKHRILFVIKKLILSICFIVFLNVPTMSQAATYSYNTDIIAYDSDHSNSISVHITGFNRTHAVTQVLNHSLSVYTSGGKYRWCINYVVPDDGSTWNVTGVITQYNFKNYDGISAGSYGFLGMDNKTFTATHTTGGSYSGASIGAATTAANTASTNALNAYNSVYNVNGNTITAVRDSGGTVLAEARQAKTNSLIAYNTAQTVNTKIDSLATAVTNIQNNLGGDTSPPEVKIATASGAMATSDNTIRAIINTSDNASSLFEYSLDGTAYQPLPLDGVVDLLVSSTGSNLITVWVKDEAGNTGRDSITIRKL